MRGVRQGAVHRVAQRNGPGDGFGHQRHPETMRHQCHAGDRVTDLLRNRDVQAPVAKDPDHAIHEIGPAGIGKENERLGGQLFQAQAVLGGQGMAGRQHGPERLQGDQLLRQIRQHRHHAIESGRDAPLPQGVDLFLAVHGVQHHVQSRQRSTQLLQQGRNGVVDAGTEHPDVEAPEPPLPDTLHAVDAGGHHHADVGCLGPEHFPGLRQLHAARRAHKQLDLQLVFDLPDLPRERRLGDAQPARSAPHVELIGNGQKILDVTQVHPASLEREHRLDPHRVTLRVVPGRDFLLPLQRGEPGIAVV